MLIFFMPTFFVITFMLTSYEQANFLYDTIPCSLCLLLLTVVMCTARLSSKAPAWARLETAPACEKYEPGPSRGPTAGSGSAQAQAEAWYRPGLGI